MHGPGRCPFPHEALKPATLGGDMVRRWWPEQLNLKILQRNTPALSPLEEAFDYAKAFAGLDYQALKRDLRAIMRDSKEWWPADFGHYGPLFIRMAWHSVGTYRMRDGRGGGNTGNQRFAPVNSWPDNVNLDKARRLLWPIKKKYGDGISWADLIILAGNVALEDMGFRTLGFGGGRVDVWEPEEDVWWGPESEWLGDARHDEKGALEDPLAAVQMGLIYVNPEGPGGEPNVLAAAADIREIFARMGMNDEETVALIAGGHAFGKCHGAAPASHLGPEPEAAPLEEIGLGWRNDHGAGKGPDTITSGIEGAWTPTPTRWDTRFLELLFKYDWNLTKSPAGAWQWEPVDPDPEDLAPDAHDGERRVKTIMLTTDLALRYDPAYARIARDFLDNPQDFEEAFARAWFKLTHRDMGPKSRYLGPEVPRQTFIWQDPLPERDFEPVNDEDVAHLKGEILASGLDVSDLVFTAWAAASTYRDSDKRGGANGARIRLAPQRGWPVNEPARIEPVLAVLEEIRARFNAAQNGPRRVSLADMIVLGGTAAVEKAARDAGHDVTVPFLPGRVDAGREQTDVEGFEYLRPVADAFRNWIDPRCALPAERLMLDRASLLTLTVPEMTVLIGGLRVLGANHSEVPHGVLTHRVGVLSNDFFVHLCDMDVEWHPVDDAETLFEAVDRTSGETRWTGTRVDLVFGANSQLRAQSEFYAQDDHQERFVRDFIAAFVKVMNLDRFDVKWR